MHISIPQRKFVWGLVFITGGLVVLSVVANFVTYSIAAGAALEMQVRKSFERLFDLDAEANIPTWFSSALLLMCATLVAANAAAKWQTRGRYRVHWIVLSVIFLYLSVDETAIIHEMSIKPLRSMLNPTGLLYEAWIIPGIAATVVFVLAYLKFLLNLPRRTALLFVIAGAVYVGGAIGVEALSGLYAETHGEENLTYKLISTIEESVEMLGLVIFINANLGYLRTAVGAITFEVALPRSAQMANHLAEG